MTRRSPSVPGSGAALAVLAALGLAACGPGPHDPRLTDLRCALPDACQSAEDPFLLRMAVDFDDPDGDLGDGEVQMFLDGAAAGAAQPLSAAFEAQALPPDATEGVLYLDVGLSLESVRSGMEFLVAMEVRDAAGHVSNRPGVRFRLDLR